MLLCCCGCGKKVVTPISPRLQAGSSRSTGGVYRSHLPSGIGTRRANLNTYLYGPVQWDNLVEEDDRGQICEAKQDHYDAPQLRNRLPSREDRGQLLRIVGPHLASRD
jgi:hypothetical protein